MKIARVAARALRVPLAITVLGLDKRQTMGVCLVEIETDTGLVGNGLTAITQEAAIPVLVERLCAPALLGEDPLRTERLWERLHWLLLSRGQTGLGSHAIAALDVALWDLKGKALGQPLWRLLGGARERVAVYATFGFEFFDRDELADAARLWVANGHTRLKMTVGNGALQRRDTGRTLEAVLREDVERVRAVREAIGADVALYVDANCSYDPYHALELARRLEPYDIGFFEEPLANNDVRALADLRRRSGMRIACGQNEGSLLRFRDLAVAGAVDVLQPNVVTGGGYTLGLKAAALAAAFGLTLCNGGAYAAYNMHLQAGVANGTMVEQHYLATELARLLFVGAPVAQGDWLDLPEAPGLGFEPDREAIAELAARSA